MPQPIDLTSCDREPITRLGTIQNFGFLVALTNDWTIARISQNVDAMLGWEPQAAIGTPFLARIADQAQHDIRNLMALLYSSGGERIYGVDLLGDGNCFDLALHLDEDLLILEGEPSQPGERMEAASLVRAMSSRLGRETSLSTFHRTAARQVQAITGFERVMIYRFDHQGNGEVIAEAVKSGMKPFLGLHFPASDIPVQARALYLKNAFRIVADVDAPAVAILPAAKSPADQIDLSMAVTRSVSPVHLEYLRHMEVKASLSISIIVDGKLWGLIACHSQDPRLPSFVMRTAAELLGAMYGMMLNGRLNSEGLVAEAQARELADKLITAIAGEPDLLSDPQWLQDMASDIIACDGVAVYRAERVYTSGAAPPPAQVERLCRHLNAASPSRIFTTDCLADHIAGFGDGDHALAPGVLSIPISRVPRDYILLFRRERRATISWGGDPTKPVETAEGAERLSPRKSFEAFLQEVRGRAMPFSARDARIGEAVRQALIEVILRQNDSAAEDRRRAGERQELLIAELNHRVRNILGLIQSLITMPARGSDVEGYVGSLHGRVQALARAHDQITRQNWGPALLGSLFEHEIAALPGARSRLIVNGPAVMLKPNAISTLALVIHELVTNSCKHGALSVETGRVEVALHCEDKQGLDIIWREVGGPPVKAPDRRGFGSTIIERAIPFELGGSAEVRYHIAGLEAAFHVPARHIVSVADAAADVSQGAGGTPVLSAEELAQDAMPLSDETVLLLEDNMLIALEAEDMLRALGAVDVHAAATVAEADRLVATHGIGFAMLDINLGQTTSFDFANRLATAGIPFVFASGYGEEVALKADRPHAVVLQKPFQKAHLVAAVRQVYRQSTLDLPPSTETPA